MTRDTSLLISTTSYCGRRYARCDGAYSLLAVRRSVDYVFNAFHSVHPAIATSRRPLTENGEICRLEGFRQSNERVL